ncbi:magnesium and cobalt transport protein CorA [Propionivibrio limicola]|uniref:magnesium and cobalt transport protein CorA n=1 Tax=Propionivibrio limicola TaxID=167645 RepID=UPI0012914A09|nr:magnesium and cobalt transport protein CorA [Propionivibrio limicola]
MLINCVAYENGTRLSSLQVEEISDFLARPECFVWVSLRDATPDELQLMKEEFALHELAVEDAHHGHQRPKIEEYGDSLFAVLHLLELTAGGELNVGEVAVFVGRNYVLSVRNRSRQDFRAVRERCEREPHLLRHGAGFVFYALMDAIVDRYFPIIDRLESELEDIEAQIFSKGAALANIKRLYELKGKIMRIKHAVAPLLEETGKLAGTRGPVVCANSREYFRDVLDHLTRINGSLDIIRDTIGTAIQANLSMVAIEEGEVNKKLAAWAGIFAVVTALAGIWGMNFRNMPELDWEYGYPVALLLLVAAGSYLRYRFKRAGWL